MHREAGETSMHINLSPEMEKFVQSKVDSGFYSNASEVIRDAIRRMREDEDKIAALRKALQVGDDQLDKGEGAQYSPELLTRLTEKAKDNARRRKKKDPDVVP
jgi:antitoxin ParD1/3/4